MKNKIILNGWQEGLDETKLLLLQANLLKLPITEAKKNVSDLFNGYIVNLLVDDTNIAHNFLIQANKIGALCDIATLELV